MNPENPDSNSLMAEWRDLTASKNHTHNEAEKAESLRQYKKLVDMIDEVLTEELGRARSPSSNS